MLFSLLFCFMASYMKTFALLMERRGELEVLEIMRSVKTRWRGNLTANC